MAATSSEISIGTAITVISAPSQDKRYVYIQNSDYAGSTEIYVGGSSVGTATGYLVWRDSNTVFELNADDGLWAIGSGAGAKARVLVVS
jgi:hypothetical protein